MGQVLTNENLLALFFSVSPRKGDEIIVHKREKRENASTKYAKYDNLFIADGYAIRQYVDQICY